MAIVGFFTCRCFRPFINYLHRKTFKLRYCFWTLTYNEFCDIYYVGDTLMEPLFWFVDNFTGLLGPIFVVLAAAMFFSIVIIAHIVGIPYYSEKHPTELWIAWPIGYWILINCCFHYWKGLILDPGKPPSDTRLFETVSICRHCIAPKPPRTHHCSICDRCVLKMDHHCPWLNNCIGHYTHRYFFLFCVYTIIGCCFIMCFGFRICYEEYTAIQKYTSPMLSRKVHRGCLLYTFLVTVGVFLALGALTVWHARLITRGETSIEAHINKTETRRAVVAGKIYKNPYDFGPRLNWRIFLGLDDGKTWFHVLLPSGHLPQGNGLRWRTAVR